MQKSKTVEDYLQAHPQWQSQLEVLRAQLLQTDLEETVKWGAPTYCLAGKNVVGLGAFKSYVGLWFHHGVFLNDPAGVLVNAQEGKTKGMRQWRFAEGDCIDTALVNEYVAQAIANQRAGKETQVQRKTDLTLPQALQNACQVDLSLQQAFARLTPGKQREYAEHIGSAKREATRQSRLEKAIPLILDGVGLNDKYR